MTSPTTQKGNIGQTAVALEALKRGYHVSIPMEGAAYDLVIDKAGTLFRVQVKYAESVDGVVFVRLREYNQNDFDAMIAYDAVSDQTFWIPMSIVTESAGLSIRWVPPKNNQTKGIVWASDYVDW